MLVSQLPHFARPFVEFGFRSDTILSNPHYRYDRRRAFVPSGLPRTRLEKGGYVAELVEDRRAGRALVHCVIQKDNSPEILYYTQFSTLAAAKAWAAEELRQYASSPGDAPHDRRTRPFKSKEQKWRIAKQPGSGRGLFSWDE